MATGRLLGHTLRVGENALAAAALVAMAVLPVLELVLRSLFRTGIPGSSGYVQNLTLWVAFLGAMVVTRERRHLQLAVGEALPGRLRPAARLLGAGAAGAVLAGLFWASLQFVLAERASPVRIGGWLPAWAAIAILPVSFAVMLLRFTLQAEGWRARVAALLGVGAAALLGFALEEHAEAFRWPGLALLVLSALLGAPIFVLLGGAALLLFFADGVAVAAVPVETARIVASPSLPMVPLFTLTGYLLAEGGTSRRLVRLFQALFGWMPGGLAIATTLCCAFFTAFTGASGVTILALGGVFLPVLVASGYRERFSTGLLTATGSLGLLFPPSLPVILYGVVAFIPIPDLFRAGLVPGALLVLAVSLYGMREGVRSRVARPPFSPREAMAAAWEAKWELLLPLPAIAGIFGGWCTLIEAAAITAVYALLVETVIHRELRLTSEVPQAVVKCVTLIGGVLVILGVAMGLTNYLVDAEIPTQAAEWVKTHIPSKILFLLALNGFLLLVGCLMDIFSAIVVVVPLLLPMGQAFGVHPLHLGMIFLANLELGYLTPPVGMNLFLASYRFEKPLVRIYRDALPFLLVLLAVVLVITYVPGIIPGVTGPPDKGGG